MKILQPLMWVSAGIVAMSLLGCHEHERRVVVAEPAYVHPEPGYIIVPEPPPVLVERRSPPPGRAYVWVDGYHHWDGHRYAWRGGHWAKPPHAGEVWVAPRYEREERGYRYTQGHWGAGGPPGERHERH